jgi:Rrf2 family protein
VFKINKKVEYALIALKHMSDKYPGELTTAKEICDVYSSPFDATSRVLQILTQQQILKSEHGAHGGYLIQKDLSKITFLKLVETILGPVQMVKCLHDEGDNNCGLLSGCNIVSPIVKLSDRLKSFYDTINLKDLILTVENKKYKMPEATKEFSV